MGKIVTMLTSTARILTDAVRGADTTGIPIPIGRPEDHLLLALKIAVLLGKMVDMRIVCQATSVKHRKILPMINRLDTTVRTSQSGLGQIEAEHRTDSETNRET